MDSDSYRDADCSSMADEGAEIEWGISSSRMETGHPSADYSIRTRQQMVLSDEDISRPSSDDDSEAGLLARNQMPGLADFRPDDLFEGEQQPIVVIIFNGVQHVFIEADVAEAESFKLSHLASSLSSVVPQTIRELAPTRVHILAASLFFGPISHFMHMLQKEFGIERDVSLEFESLALSVPINMSFATTSLSLAHIFAISTAHATSAENVAPILVANLVVEMTNFVKQYNELVHNFKSRRSLHISSSPKERTQYNLHDDTCSVHSAHSTQSLASSTWSQLAVRDSASVAGVGDLETSRIEEWDTTTHRNSSFRLGLHSSLNEFKINASSSRDHYLTYSDDSDTLSVRSVEPNHSSSSRSSKSFAYPLERSTAPSTPPSSLSRKRQRGTLHEGSSEMHSEDEDPPAPQSGVKRPKMLGNQALAPSSSSGIATPKSR